MLVVLKASIHMVVIVAYMLSTTVSSFVPIMFFEVFVVISEASMMALRIRFMIIDMGYLYFFVVIVIWVMLIIARVMFLITA